MGKLTGKGKHTVKVGNHPHTNMISKPAIMRRGEYKCKILEMHLKLKNQQLKTILYIYRLPYQNLMVTANWKSTIDTHTKEKKQSKHNTKASHQITKKEKKRKGGKKTYKNKSKTINKRAIRTYISIITLNVNGLKAPTKRHRLVKWIQKQNAYICCLQETHFRPRDTYRPKVRRWKKVFHENGNQKKPGVAILLSDKIDFKIKRLCLFVTRDKEGHYTLIKESIQEEDITIINIYASNIGAPQYIRQMLSHKRRNW